MQHATQRNVDEVRPETTFFNILVRTSGRPNYFAGCVESIRQQTHQHFQILVSYDNPETFAYVRTYEGIIPIAVASQSHSPAPGPGADRPPEPFLPNLYFNTLLEHIQEGFVLFLDDDDCLRSPQTLEIISRHINSPDDLLFWQVRLAENLLIPSAANFGSAPMFRQINTSGFTFHSKYVQNAQWDGWRGSDYFVANKLYEAVPHKVYIKRSLTGSQDQHALPGRGWKNDKAISLKEMKAQYERMGYLPPVRILGRKDAHHFLQQVQKQPKTLPMDWPKGYAANVRVFYELATHPAILERVSALIGPDIILWGASVVNRPAGTSHPWHCDVEASAPRNGKTLNVWIGLKNTSIRSGLQFIPFSHTFKTIQQIRQEKGLGRRQVGQEQILEWARERDPQAWIMKPVIADGEALFFNGKIWHGSNNQTQHPRFALLLQYASPEAAIRLPDPNNFEWPFRQMSHPKPPVILIQGDDKAGVNRLVQAPVSQQTPGRFLMAASRVYPLEVPLALPKDNKWKPYHIFNGVTANLQHLTCHASVLAPGHRPHPPHNHPEEEILIILDGEADVILPEIAEPKGRKRRLRRGDFVYYPAHFLHTLESVGEKPVNYLMFKWYNPLPSPPESLPFGQFHGIAGRDASTGKPIKFGLLFEGGTTCLRKLHCHTSVLQPGASYKPHCDPYDVAIVVLEGKVETLDEVVGANHIIFYPAGTMHGMANPTDRVARYLVFEFHGHHPLQDRQVKPLFAVPRPTSTPKKADASPPAKNTVDRSRYDQLMEQYRALENSYSLKIGRSITQTVERSLGWLPFVKRRMKSKDR